jgi:hypothetical protein
MHVQTDIFFIYQEPRPGTKQDTPTRRAFGLLTRRVRNTTSPLPAFARVSYSIDTKRGRFAPLYRGSGCFAPRGALPRGSGFARWGELTVPPGCFAPLPLPPR